MYFRLLKLSLLNALYMYLRFSCPFLFWSLLYRISHFKSLPEVSLHNNHFHSSNIFKFFIKLLIFHFKTAPDMFSERSSPFCFPFCLTANPSLRLLALGNRPEDQRGSEKKDHSLTQEFKKFEPQEKSRHIVKEDSKMLEWYYKYKDSTILFLWLLYINRYFFSIEKIHNYYLHKYCREYFYYTI